MLEQFPIVVPGVALGYAAGLATDVISVRKASENLGAISVTHEKAVDRLNADDKTSKSRSRVSRFGAPLALTGALLGGSVGMLFQNPGAKVSSPSSIEIVVDHSGSTLADDTNPGIDRLVSEFNNEKFNSTVLIAGSGQVIVSKPKDVSKDGAFGIAPLDQALTTALTQIDSNQGSRNANAVLVISDDNAAGSVDSAVSLAKSSETPIFTIDVSPVKSQTSTDLRNLAKNTGGRFWHNPSDMDHSKIVSEISSSINSDNRNISKNSSNADIRDISIILSSLSLAAFSSLVWNRRFMRFDRNIKGK
jgi:hypothetical protein